MLDIAKIPDLSGYVYTSEYKGHLDDERRRFMTAKKVDIYLDSSKYIYGQDDSSLNKLRYLFKYFILDSNHNIHIHGRKESNNLYGDKFSLRHLIKPYLIYIFILISIFLIFNIWNIKSPIFANFYSQKKNHFGIAV